MQKLFYWIRCRIGLRLLRAAVEWLPTDTPEAVGIQRRLCEQYSYERYAAVTQLMGCEPFSFAKWREVWSTFQLRSAAPRMVHMASGSHRPLKTRAAR